MEFFKEGDEDINLTGLSSEFLKTVIVKKYISFDKANRLLRERGKVVRTNPKYMSAYHWAPIFSDGDTHQALLVCIEPIEQDSAEKIFEDLAKASLFITVPRMEEFIERAKWQTKLQQEKLIHEEFRVKEFEADIEKYNEMYDRHVAVRKERDQLKATCDRYEKALRDIATDIPCSDYVARQALEDSK